MYLQYVLKSFLVLLLMGMLYLGSKAYKEAVLFEQHTQTLVSHQSIEEQANRKLEKLATSILGDLYTTTEVDLAPLKEKQQHSMRKAKKYTLYFMGLLLLLMLSFFLLSLRAFTFFGALASLITLVFGLIAPILMVTIHKEVEYLGDVVLSFESKGVMGSVIKLWESSDMVIAIVILLFSVIVPGLKVLSLLFISVFIENKFADKIVVFFKAIGKWSMVDVFIVAVFLVYLTSKDTDVSRAEVEVGLYFFLAYVIVSMIVSLTADKMLKQNKA